MKSILLLTMFAMCITVLATAQDDSKHRTGNIVLEKVLQENCDDLSVKMLIPESWERVFHTERGGAYSDPDGSGDVGLYKYSYHGEHLLGHDIDSIRKSDNKKWIEECKSFAYYKSDTTDIIIDNIVGKRMFNEWKHAPDMKDTSVFIEFEFFYRYCSIVVRYNVSASELPKYNEIFDSIINTISFEVVTDSTE